MRCADGYGQRINPCALNKFSRLFRIGIEIRILIVARVRLTHVAKFALYTDVQGVCHRAPNGRAADVFFKIKRGGVDHDAGKAQIQAAGNILQPAAMVEIQCHRHGRPGRQFLNHRHHFFRMGVIAHLSHTQVDDDGCACFFSRRNGTACHLHIDAVDGRDGIAMRMRMLQNRFHGNVHSIPLSSLFFTMVDYRSEASSRSISSASDIRLTVS